MEGFIDGKLVSAAEIQARCDREDAEFVKRWIRHDGRDYGMVNVRRGSHYNANHRVIYLDPGDRGWYPIGIGRLTQSSQVLDFVYQVHLKRWRNKNRVSDFLNCLSAACGYHLCKDNPQGVYCSMGQDLKAVWPL